MDSYRLERYRQLQIEQATWRCRNFQDEANSSKPHRQLMGMVEELGEIMEELMQNPTFPNPGPTKDAIADYIIFAAGYCTDNGFDLASIICEAYHAPLDSSLFRWPHMALKWAGRLCHRQLKREQKIRGTDETLKAQVEEALVRLTSVVIALSEMLEFDLDTIVRETWEGTPNSQGVRDRDWCAYRLEHQ